MVPGPAQIVSHRRTYELGMKRLLLISTGLLALTLTSIVPAASAPPDPAPVAPLMKLRPALQARVDALMTFNAVESSHIGAAGAPSDSHAAWQAVREEATDSELSQLLGHGHPIVRGYVAQHLARTAKVIDQGTRAKLELLLRDSGSVRVRDGCIGGQETVATIVLRELCWNTPDKTGSQAILRTVAGDKSYGTLSEAAARCVVK